MSALHCWVSGRVQGVFYRASACQRATELGLRGWVRNLDDGRVELLVCGDEPRLQALQAWLTIGPPGARVDSVECQPVAAPDDIAEHFEQR
ncbi:MAG: acylphosphatase [Gammaproteobacteria bacterium]|nr:acylphosphatase [Gammaproteobacteria bacterium]